MSRGHSHSMNSFPSVYRELIETVWSGQVVRVPYPDLRSARAARCRFYDYKKLLRKQTDENLRLLCDQAESIQLYLEGTTVVYILRDATEEAATIANALRNAGGVGIHTPDDIDAELERLDMFPGDYITPPPIRTQDDLLSTYLTEPQKTIDSDSTSE